jgi:hypothetical protein
MLGSFVQVYCHDSDIIIFSKTREPEKHLDLRVVYVLIVLDSYAEKPWLPQLLR